jgi:hypothetical protein
MATPESNGVKRRQSEEAEQESKRQRVSPGKTPPPNAEGAQAEERRPSKSESADARADLGDHPEDARPARRKSMAVDEKKRGKRLFGALLGNLSQPSDRGSKRRREIEERRKAELQRQDDERLEDKQKRLERLNEHRGRVQKDVDERNVCARSHVWRKLC